LKLPDLYKASSMTENCSRNCPPQIIHRRRRMKVKKHSHLQSTSHKARCSQRLLNFGPQLVRTHTQCSSSLPFTIQHIFPICQVQPWLQIRSKFRRWRWFDCILPTLGGFPLSSESST
jgi:hypothetical protein